MAHIHLEMTLEVEVVVVVEVEMQLPCAEMPIVVQSNIQVMPLAT